MIPYLVGQTKTTTMFDNKAQSLITKTYLVIIASNGCVVGLRLEETGLYHNVLVNVNRI